MSTIIMTMTTKCNRVVTDRKGLLLIKLHAHLITWLWNFTWQTKKIIFPIWWYIMVTKLGRLMTCNRELPFIKLNDPSTRWLSEVIKLLYTRPMATKHGKVDTYCDGHPPIKSQNLLNICSHDNTQQINNISLLHHNHK